MELRSRGCHRPSQDLIPPPSEDEALEVLQKADRLRDAALATCSGQWVRRRMVLTGDPGRGAGPSSMVNHRGLLKTSRVTSDYILQLPPRSTALGKGQVLLDKLIHPLNRQ